jgi:hypothetical protein
MQPWSDEDLRKLGMRASGEPVTPELAGIERTEPARDDLGGLLASSSARARQGVPEEHGAGNSNLATAVPALVAEAYTLGRASVSRGAGR